MRTLFLFVLLGCFQAANAFDVFGFGGLAGGFRQSAEESQGVNPLGTVLRATHGGLKVMRHVDDLHQVAKQLEDKQYRRPDEQVIRTANGKVISGHDSGPVTMDYTIYVESKDD
ncbi:unnamed protein product [Dibothriocephalus latus]|uniref:Uncharacterized protein n=1 Tax=Dibothriocephalus latus TaxID=60516 RepID=A0A3P7P1Z5_DIBLA|nr:unnamed protein product [Dibothriocephalus latus]